MKLVHSTFIITTLCADYVRSHDLQDAQAKVLIDALGGRNLGLLGIAMERLTTEDYTRRTSIQPLRAAEDLLAHEAGITS
jgi:hypothetical protein